MLPYKIIATGENHSLNCFYLETILSPWIDTKSSCQDDYSLDAIVLLSNPWTIETRLLAHLMRGGLCIVDGLWENWLGAPHVLIPYLNQIIFLTAGDTKNKIENYNIISIPNWFWYNESLWYQSLGYDEYFPTWQEQRSNSFFMPLRNMSTWRNKIVQNLTTELESAIWSYVDQGRVLPGYNESNKDDQRYFLPEWYDNTWYSLVVETTQNPGTWFMTEKVFKPIAYYHPFLVFGQEGILKRLQQIGFETFPEIFDESYDQESDNQRRLEMVCKQVKWFDRSKTLQPIVKEKLRYNHDRFFDRNLVIDSIQKELIEPLLSFINGKFDKYQK